jgi:hypothetical protein
MKIPYFIFCADNGTAVTAKDRGVERGVHVPYVVRGPGIKPLGITDELTDFSDVAPTLLEMAGISKPDDLYLDGMSQVPFLTGKTRVSPQMDICIHRFGSGFANQEVFVGGKVSFVRKTGRSILFYG